MRLEGQSKNVTDHTVKLRGCIVRQVDQRCTSVYGLFDIPMINDFDRMTTCTHSDDIG